MNQQEEASTEGEKMLDLLYTLVQKEQETVLTENEKCLYISLADVLKERGINIPFGIEL